MGKPARITAISPGDSLSKVYARLGTPTIEYPLRGRLIQNYGDFTIISTNGVVISLKNNDETDSTSSRKKSATNTKSYESTFATLLLKAKQGDAESQYQLAYCYQSGTGVLKNQNESIRWYTIAAMQGHLAAQHNLGVIYMNGDGVEKDLQQACTWAVLASKNGNDTLLKVLVERLSADQELAGRLRAKRILDGIETPPYPSEQDIDTISHNGQSSHTPDHG